MVTAAVAMAATVVARITRLALITGIVQTTENRGMAVQDILTGGRLIGVDALSRSEIWHKTVNDVGKHEVIIHDASPSMPRPAGQTSAAVWAGTNADSGPWY